MEQTIKKFLDVIERTVRPRTYPVGLKLLREVSDIPKGISRAPAILGHRVSLCQGFAFSRYRKVPLAMLKEDMVCPIGAMVLGAAEPPDYFLAGETYVKRSASTPEAAARMARALYRFEPGTYVGAVTAPLSECHFDIDLVLIYVNPFQLGNLVLGARYREGGRFPAQVLPSAVCDVIVPTFKEGQCHFNIPCSGDRRYGRAADDELLFAAPVKKLDELTEGLNASLENNSIAVVSKQWLECEPTMPAFYDKVRKDLDML